MELLEEEEQSLRQREENKREKRNSRTKITLVEKEEGGEIKQLQEGKQLEQ